MLKDVLQYLEERLDLEHVENTRQCLKKVIEYKEPDWVPVKVGYPKGHAFKAYPYPEAFNDMEKMMCNELMSFIGGMEIQDATVPMIRANYGVGILPSLFGLNCRLVNNDLPWVDHFESIEDIKKLIDKGIPDMRAGLGGRVLDTHEYYNEILDSYPKCKKGIAVYHPDMQGPFDVAHLIWGPDIYYALYDEPEVVHDLLKLVTATYIAFMKEVKKQLQDEDGDYVYHWGTIYPGRVVLRDDSPVNLSREMYEEFVKPYDETVLKEFGGGSMHYCGRADQWVFSMMETEKLGAMNFGQPPNMIFGFDFLGKIYGRAKEKKIGIVGYGMEKESLDEILSSEYITGVTFNVGAESKEEALDIVRRCKR